MPSSLSLIDAILNRSSTSSASNASAPQRESAGAASAKETTGSATQSTAAPANNEDTLGLLRQVTELLTAVISATQSQNTSTTQQDPLGTNFINNNFFQNLANTTPTTQTTPAPQNTPGTPTTTPSTPTPAPVQPTATANSSFTPVRGEDMRLWLMNSDFNGDSAVDANEAELMARQLTGFNPNVSNALNRLASELRTNRTDPIFADGKITFSETIGFETGLPRVVPSEFTQLIGRSGNPLSLEESDLTTPANAPVTPAAINSDPGFIALPMSFSNPLNFSAAAGNSTPFNSFSGLFSPFVFPS